MNRPYWRMRSPVKAFPRNLRNGLPLRRIGRSGDSRLNPSQNLLMPMADGQLESIWSQLHYAKRTHSLPPLGGAQKKDTQPSQTCSEGYTFLSPPRGGTGFSN